MHSEALKLRETYDVGNVITNESILDGSVTSFYISQKITNASPTENEEYMIHFMENLAFQCSIELTHILSKFCTWLSDDLKWTYSAGYI